MTAIAPEIQVTGNEVPFREYIASISSSFPLSTRPRIIESAIAGRSKIDVLPVNVGYNNHITDNYLEFRIPGVTGQFLDLSSLVVDLDIGLLKEDGSDLVEEDHAALCNGLSNTLFRTANCYLNEQMVESNVYFAYTSFIKIATSIPPQKMNTLGRCD